MKKKNLNLIQYFFGEEGSLCEGLFMAPDEGSNFPLVIFVHGFNAFGAWEDLFMVRQMMKSGFAVLLLSQPGFGQSEGTRDYCGPNTVSTITNAIKEASKISEIDSSRIGLWGISRGAMVSSQVVCQLQGVLKACVLQSGAYDFFKYHRDVKDERIRENMMKETEGTDHAWKERSSILNLDNIDVPILILHGDSDETISVEQAYDLSKALEQKGKPFELQIVPGGGHMMGRLGVRKDFVVPFFQKYL